MKRIAIGLIMLAAVWGFCEDNSLWYNESRVATIPSLGTTNTILSVSGNDVGAKLFKPSYAEGYNHDADQSFLAASGYQVITGYLPVVSENVGTLTSSNLTVIADGCYMLIAPYGVKTASANNFDVHVHAYTNGVEATNCGGGTYITTAAQNKSFTVAGMLCLVSNDVVDLRISVGKNCTLTFKHKSATLFRLSAE